MRWVVSFELELVDDPLLLDEDDEDRESEERDREELLRLLASSLKQVRRRVTGDADDRDREAE